MLPHRQRVLLGAVGRLPLALSAILTAAILVSLLWFSRYGLDLTDESFYLVWMANPFNYSFSTTQFGFIYHPLYSLFGGDITALRQANIIMIFGLAWIICNLFLKGLLTQVSEPFYVRIAISAAIATSSLVVLAFAGLWLPTPSYNTLAFKGLLIITIGMLLTDKTASRSSNLGWLLVGLGGWLAFMAKPPTAAAAGIVVIAYVLVSGRFTLRALLAPLSFTILLLISAYALDGSIMKFIDRYKVGLEFASILGGGHSIESLFRLDVFQLPMPLTEIFWIVFFVALLGLLISSLTLEGAGVLVAAMQVLLIVIGILGIYLFLSHAIASDVYQNLIFGAVLFAAIPVGIATLSRLRFFSPPVQVLIIVVGLAYYYQVCGQIVTFQLALGLLAGAALIAIVAIIFILVQIKSVRELPLDYWALVFPFAGFVYAYAFGTNNNYWVLMGSAGLFLVLLGLTLLAHLAGRREFPRLLLTVAIVVQLISAGLLIKGLESPYRQPNSLYKNTYSMELGAQGGRLLLAQSFGEYISTARDIVSRSGFIQGTPMIDMTGHSPGTLHILGAQSVGVAWALGGYPGSERFVEASLKLVPCRELAEAWLITEPKGPRLIPDRVLESFGASYFSHFEIVGEVVSPDGQVQQFFKPTRSQETAVIACRDKRLNL